MSNLKLQKQVLTIKQPVKTWRFKSFWNSSHIVAVWMNSPGHRKNLLKRDFMNVGYARCLYKSGSNQSMHKQVIQMFTLPK